MKKPLLAVLALCCFLQVQAQDYRFYAGLQGGPKISYSNMVLPGQNQTNFNIYRKIRHQEGLVAGFNFPNNRLSLEAGYSRHTHGVSLTFPQHPAYGKTPDLWYNFNGDQVSMLAKITLNKPEAKVRLQAALGGAYFMKWHINKSNFDYYNNLDRYGFLEFPYPDDPHQKFGFKPYDILWFEAAPSVLLVQTGLDAQVSLGKRFILSLSCLYQSSLQPVESRSFKYSHNYSRGVWYEPEQTGSAISKAEAINLNLGIYYCFSKRDQP